MDLSLEDSECPTANGDKEKEWQQNIPVRVLDYCNLLKKLSSDNSVGSQYLFKTYLGKLLLIFALVSTAFHLLPKFSVLDPNPLEFVIFFSPELNLWLQILSLERIFFEQAVNVVRMWA
jgi:hypothetical protein